jgi:hypothetical protein
VGASAARWEILFEKRVSARTVLDLLSLSIALGSLALIVADQVC